MFIKLLFSLILSLSVVGIGIAQTIRIGVSLGLTGKYKQEAEMQRKAFRLWESDVNHSGGILNQQVKLTIYDDQSNAVKAKSLYRRMIEREKMDLLFLPYSSALTMAVLPITENHGYPMLTSGAAADRIWQQNYRYVFGVFPKASRYTLGFMEMLLANDLNDIAIISADDPFSLSVAAGAGTWAQRLALNIVLRRTFKKGAQDLDQIADELKRTGPHAVLLCGHFEESVDLRQALNNVNWYPEAYYASVGPAFKKYRERLGEDAEKSFTSTNWHYYDKLPFPGAKTFFESFTKKYAIEPAYQAATAYASGMILKTAIEKTGTLDKKQIRNTLAALDTFTIIGRYGVDRTGMQIKHFQVILQWINNRKEIVWPKELMTVTPLFGR